LLTASGGFTVVIGLDGLQIALAMVIIKVGQCVASARRGGGGERKIFAHGLFCQSPETETNSH
jgi:hypothetical protein